MNAKRQTIWLVSMLSLMVVLSAYYLFTEDVSKLDLASTDAANAPQELKIDTKETEQTATTAGTEVKSDAKTTANETVKTTDADKAAAKDAEVLEKVKAQAASAGDFFYNEQLKRHETFSKESEKWMAIATDSKQKPEAAAAALAEFEKLSDMQQKIESLEELLMKDFAQAIVTQGGKKWKIVVQAEKLEKSQGVAIVDLVEKELGAAPENVKIQYVKP